MTRHRGVGLATIMMAMALVLAACGSSSPSSSKASSSRSGGTVTEAAVIAYTGTNAFEGGVTDAGLYPAAYEINKAGGILGKRLTILPVDTRGDPADALPLMEKMLATTHNLLGISGLGTESGPTLIPVANSAHVVSTISAGEATYDRMTYPYIWRLLPPDPVNGEAMALWARHLGIAIDDRLTRTGLGDFLDVFVVDRSLGAVGCVRRERLHDHLVVERLCIRVRLPLVDRVGDLGCRVVETVDICRESRGRLGARGVDDSDVVLEVRHSDRTPERTDPRADGRP